MANEPRFKMEDVTPDKIPFRNFSGRPAKFSPQGGVRDFSVILDPETAHAMAGDGWTIKTLPPREEGDDPTPFISIKVRFDKRPPRIVLVMENGNRVQLNEDTVDVLDWTDIKTLDLIVTGSYWDFNGKTGWAAYLKSLFVKIQEDELEKKYKINESPPAERK